MKVVMRTLTVIVLLGLGTGCLSSRASAQSVWDKLKQQGQKTQPPNQQPQSQQRGGAPQQQQGLAGPISVPGPVTPPAGTKVEATLLAPYEQGSSFQISPHGGHAATVSHKGSRPVIVYDGVPNPIFDNFISQHGGGNPVEFSPDGNHYAYCGLSPDHMTIMLDGKELFSDADQNAAGFNCTTFFSPNSKHFFYTEFVNKGSWRQGLQYTRFVMDGKTEVKFGGAYDNRNIVFSPDGDHFAMVIDDPTPGPNNQAVRKLIVDGKPVPFPGGSPQWSADSKHLYTTGNFNDPHGGGGQDLFLDGKPIMRATRITLTIPPVGDMTVAIVYVSNNGNPPPLTETWFLVVGGKKIANSEVTKRAGSGSSAGIDRVFISPDGKHYAAICRGVTGRSYVFADGKKGLEYQRLNGLGGSSLQAAEENHHQTNDFIGFTAPSEKVIYTGFNDPGQYLVVGDEETKAPNFNGVIVSPTGDHVAVFGQGAPMLDGKYLDLGGSGPGLAQTTWFRFSADGSHYSFQQNQRMVVDGVPLLAFSFAGGTLAGLWSPDSKHLAFLCVSTDPSAPPNQNGLCLDGKYIGLGPGSFGNLTFSPDSNHIYFTQSISQGGFRLYADGRPVLEGYPTGGGVGSFGKETFEMHPDGTLVVVAQDNTGLKRYSITASPSSSIATLLGGAGGTAAAAKR